MTEQDRRQLLHRCSIWVLMLLVQFEFMCSYQPCIHVLGLNLNSCFVAILNLCFRAKLKLALQGQCWSHVSGPNVNSCLVRIHEFKFGPGHGVQVRRQHANSSWAPNISKQASNISSGELSSIVKRSCLPRRSKRPSLTCSLRETRSELSFDL